MSGVDVDPGALPLNELRDLRASLQRDENVVSYVRRLAQVKLDLVRAQLLRLDSGDPEPLARSLPSILAHNLTSGPGRPPRPVVDFSDHALAVELDEIDERVGAGDIDSMDAAALREYALALERFEEARSAERRDLFTRIDVLSAELVRRYRDGEAHVDGLLSDE